MRERLPAPVVGKYYLYKATTSFGFFAPVFTLFLLYRDLAYTEIALLSAQHATLTVVGEVPTGYIGDRLGRRTSLVISTVAMTLSIGGFVIADSFVSFSVLYALWSLSLVFRSGTGDAWLYETLRDRLADEDRFTTVRGRAESVGLATTVTTMLAGGTLYAVDPTLPFAASTVLHALGVPVLLSLPRTSAFDGARNDQPSDAVATVRETANAVYARLWAPGMRSVVAYAALFFGLVAVVDTYVQPIARDVVGIPEPLLGVLYAGFTLGAAAASYAAGPLEGLLGAKRATFLLAPAVTVAVGLGALVPLLALPVFLLHKGANAALRSIVAGYLNDHSADTGRATTLSAASMAYALVRLPLVVAIGVVADRFGPLAAVGVVAAVCLVGMVGVLGGRAVASEATPA